EKVLRSEGEGPLAGVVRLIPMHRVNAVLVVTSQPRYLDQARRVLGLERRVQNATMRAWHVYYVQNGQSADLENLLHSAFTPGHVSPTPAPPGTTAPGAQPLRMTGGTGTGLGAATGPGASGTRGSGLITAAQPGGPSNAAPGAPDAANPAAEALSAVSEAAAA